MLDVIKKVRAKLLNMQSFLTLQLASFFIKCICDRIWEKQPVSEKKNKLNEDAIVPI